MTTPAEFPLRLLLVDDDTDDCDLFRDALKDTGINATLQVAFEGSHIMDLLNRNSASLPHLIFMDLNMPNVSGADCLREIRRASYLNSIPVIIFTTSSRPADIDETFAGGANLYLQKPSNYGALVGILNKILALDWRKYISERNRSSFYVRERIPA